MKSNYSSFLYTPYHKLYTAIYSFFVQLLKKKDYIKTLHVRNPIRTVFRCQSTANEQNNINYPPDTNTAQSEQLSNCCTSLAQAESVDTKESQKYAVDQCCCEIVASIPKGKLAV